jgi:hypothetical protein
MSAPTLPPPVVPDLPPTSPTRRPSSGRLVLGGLLVVLGLVWLAENLGVVDLRWQTVLSVAVLLVGLALLATAHSGRGDGLVPLGIVLSVLLAVTSAVPSVPLRAGVGDREHRPASVSELRSSYELGTGNLVLDLRQLTLPTGSTSVRAELGFGELVVRVPEDVAVQVDATTGAGDLDVLGVQRDGLSPTLRHTAGTGDRRLVLDLTVGFGSIEVTR